MSYRSTFCLIAALAVAPVAAQQKKPDTNTGGPDIVVTATSLRRAQEALARCIEQHCPPDKDIDATLAVAETQFVAGDYKGARTTMLQSLGRNHRYAKSYPVPVSDLQRANSRVAAHLGEQGAYFSGALDVVSTLKGGLPEGDSRVLIAYTELGDAYARTGRLVAAIDTYRKAARRAQALALPRVEGFALLRIAAVYGAASSLKDDGAYASAVAAADELIARTEPELAPYAKAAKLLKFKLAVKRGGDPAAVDRLIAAYRDAGAGQARPVLLYAPTIDLPKNAVDDPPGGGIPGGETITRMQVAKVEDQWVDIGFEVLPDGKVGEVDVLRQSPTLAGIWVKPIVSAVAGRRYAPLAADSPSAQRVERYTFTAAWTTVTGTRLRVRSPQTRLEMLDLTREPTGAGS